jgi:hypothetical protein
LTAKLKNGFIDFMARQTIDEKKTEIVNDLHAILNSADISKRMKKKVIHLAAWAWSQLPGKISKTNYWSKLAEKVHDNKESDSKLVFDHVVPRKEVAKILLTENSLSRGNIKTIFEKFCFGCVICDSEDERLTENKLRDKMPKGWNKDSGDVWARYDFVEPKIERNRQSII